MTNSTIQIGYLFCTAFLFLVMFVSGAAKFIQEDSQIFNNASLPIYIKYLNDIFYSKCFAIVEVAISIAFLRNSTSWMMTLGALFCLVLLILGLWIEKNQLSCNCFGSLSPNTRHGQLSLRLSIALAAAYLIVVSTTVDRPISSEMELQKNVQLFVFTLAGLFTFSLLGDGLKNSINKAKKSSERKENSTPIMLEFSKNTFLGYQLDVATNLENVAKPDQPLLVIFLSSNCQHCRELIPDLQGYIKGFGTNLPIVVVTSQVENAFNELTSMCTILNDDKKSLYKLIKAEVSPFGLLLHGTELRQMAPVAYGSDRIRLLFSMALNIR